MTKQAEIVTFGCRLNTYESEIMRDLAAKAKNDHEVVILNTCAVTSEAHRQARQTVRKLRREKPDAKIYVTGCAAQIDPQSFAEMPEVDRVFGNEEKMKPETYLEGSQEKVVVDDIMAIKEMAPQFIDGFTERARAFVQVQNGCDHRCTFCRIPYGRGNSRSVPMGHLVEQVKILTQKGYTEIVLTGVDITSYGTDLPGKPSLGQMVKRMMALVPDIKRLRLSSIDSIEVDEDLFWLLENDPRMMPHFHLSLQAGDNMVLKRMKRRHSREDAIEFCQRIRAIRPDVTFGADIIAGFPTETEEMFDQSLKLIDDCGLSFLHVFPYSALEGTPAAKMPQVDGIIKKDRAKRLREKGNQAKMQLYQSHLSKTAEVFVEREGFGHSEHMIPVQLTGEGAQNVGVQEIVKVQLVGVEKDYMLGKIL